MFGSLKIENKKGVEKGGLYTPSKLDELKCFKPVDFRVTILEKKKKQFF